MWMITNQTILLMNHELHGTLSMKLPKISEIRVYGTKLLSRVSVRYSRVVLHNALVKT